MPAGLGETIPAAWHGGGTAPPPPAPVPREAPHGAHRPRSRGQCASVLVAGYKGFYFGRVDNGGGLFLSTGKVKVGGSPRDGGHESVSIVKEGESQSMEDGVGWLVILTNRTVTVQEGVCWGGSAGLVGTAPASIGPSNCQVEGKLGAHTMRSGGSHYFPPN